MASAGAAVDSPPLAAPQSKFAEPPLVSGELQLSVRPLTDAIIWITRTVQEEQACRKSLELRLSAVHDLAENARALASELALPPVDRAVSSADRALSSDDRGLSNSDPALPDADQQPPSSDESRQEVRQLQAIVRDLQKNQEVQRKNQQADSSLAQETLGLRLAELRHELAAKATAEEMETLKASIAEKVREIVNAETRKMVNDRLAREAEQLRARLDRTSQALSRRLDSFGEQLVELGGVDVDVEDDQPLDDERAASEDGPGADQDASLVKSASDGADAPAATGRRGSDAPTKGSAFPAAAKSGGLPGLQARVKQIEDKIQDMEGLLAQTAADYGLYEGLEEGTDAPPVGKAPKLSESPSGGAGSSGGLPSPSAATRGGLGGLAARVKQLEDRFEELDTLQPQAAEPVSHEDASLWQKPEKPAAVSQVSDNAPATASTFDGPGVDLSDPHEIVKFFTAQLSELSKSLAAAKAERDTKIRDSMEEIQEELRKWWAEEMKTAARQQAADQADEGARLGPSALDDIPESEAFAPMSVQSTPLGATPSHRSSPQGQGRRKNFDDVRDALLKDEDFLSAVADFVDDGFKLDVGPKAATDASAAQGKRGSRGADTPERRERRGVAGLVIKLQERLAAIEDMIGPEPGANAPDSKHDSSFMGLLQVGDELRRLKCRFEYLERIVPPDVQRALQFFEPLPNDQGPPGGVPGSGAIVAMQKVHDLHIKQEQVSKEAKGLAEDSRREVENVTRALRGVQRDAEVSGGKIDDLRTDLITLRARIEDSLPRVLQAIEDVAERAGVEPPTGPSTQALPALTDAKDALVPASQNLFGQSLQTAIVPHPFVSEDALHRAIEALQGDMQAWMDKLRNDIIEVVRGKADSDSLRSLAEQLAKQEQHKVQMTRTLLELQASGSKADSAAILRMQARCVSCDGEVEVKAADPKTMWKPMQPVVPAPGFPNRTHPGKDLRPMGAGMQRNTSLPALPPPTGAHGQALPGASRHR